MSIDRSTTDSDVTHNDVAVDVADVVEDDGKAWPPRLETKSLSGEVGAVEVKDASADIAATLEVTDDPYRFRIIGGVTGIVDKVGDNVLPGAYAKTLSERRPKIIKDHDWGQRLGRCTSIKELRPGDPELPTHCADGSPWPREAGALVADVLLFKNSVAGREAAERWRAEGVEQQFSIGYKVPSGMAVKGAGGTRNIKALDLYEISDVLWGAAPLSTLLPTDMAVKWLHGAEEMEAKADDLDEDIDADEDEDLDDVDPNTVEDVDVSDEELFDPASFDELGEDVAPTVEDIDPAVDTDIERGDDEESRAPSVDDAGEHTADTLHDDHSASPSAPTNREGAHVVVEGDKPRDGDPEDAAPSVGDNIPEGDEETNSITIDDVTDGKALPEALKRQQFGKNQVTAQDAEDGVQTPDGVDEIKDPPSLRKAVTAWRAASGANKPVIGAYIKKRAAALKLSVLVPDELSGGKKDEEEDVETKYDTSPSKYDTINAWRTPMTDCNAQLKNLSTRLNAVAVSVGTSSPSQILAKTLDAETASSLVADFATLLTLLPDEHKTLTGTSGSDGSIDFGPLTGSQATSLKKLIASVSAKSAGALTLVSTDTPSTTITAQGDTEGCSVKDATEVLDSLEKTRNAFGRLLATSKNEGSDEQKYDTSPVGTPGGKENWVDKAGGLPPFIRAVSHALIRNGHSKSRAIALAVGSIRRWATGGGDVSEETRAKAVKTMAAWEAMKAKAKATKSLEPLDEHAPDGLDPVDDTLVEDVDTIDAAEDEAASGSAERKSLTSPFFAGSVEERRALLRHALDESKALGEFEGDATVQATFDEFAIVAVWPEDGDGRVSYKVDYAYDAEAGTLDLGLVQQVKIHAVTADDATDADVDAALTSLVDATDEDINVSAVETATKSFLDGIESKAGRTMSASNAERLHAAIKSLIDAAESAGMSFTTTGGDEDEVTDEGDVDTKSDTVDDDAAFAFLAAVKARARSRF